MWYALGTLSRWLVFAGILTAVGAVAFRALVLPRHPPGAAPTGPGRYDPASGAARVGMLAMRLLLLGVAGRLAAQLAVFRDPFEPLAGELRVLLADTTWGAAWTAQALMAVAGLLAFFLATRAGRIGRALSWSAVGLIGIGLSATPAFSGHALGTEPWTGAVVVADTVHVLAGGIWLGTLAVTAAVVGAARRHGDHVGRARLVGWIAAFSPIALGSAAAIATTGAFASWLHLDRVSSLWASPYGRFLSLKLGLLGLVLACGAYNWRRSRGRVHASGSPPRLPSTVGIELATGAALLLVTAVLVTTPMPGE